MTFTIDSIAINEINNKANMIWSVYGVNANVMATIKSSTVQCSQTPTMELGRRPTDMSVIICSSKYGFSSNTSKAGLFLLVSNFSFVRFRYFTDVTSIDVQLFIWYMYLLRYFEAKQAFRCVKCVSECAKNMSTLFWRFETTERYPTQVFSYHKIHN